MKLLGFERSLDPFAFDPETGEFRRVRVAHGVVWIEQKLRKPRPLKNMTLWGTIEETTAFLMNRSVSYIVTKGEDLFDHRGGMAWLRQGDGFGGSWHDNYLRDHPPVAAFVGTIFQDGGKFFGSTYYEAQRRGKPVEVQTPNGVTGYDERHIYRVFVTADEWPFLLGAIRAALEAETANEPKREERERYRILVGAEYPFGVICEGSVRYGLSIRASPGADGGLELLADGGVIHRANVSVDRMVAFARKIMPGAVVSVSV